MSSKLKSTQIQAKLGPNQQVIVQADQHELVIDQPKAAGGDDLGPTPLQMMFAALAGCIGTIGRLVAMQEKITLRDMHMRISGDLDVMVLLGRNTEDRAGFQSIRIEVDLDADLTDEEKLAFLHKVESRCPVSDNLAARTPIELSLASFAQ